MIFLLFFLLVLIFFRLFVLVFLGLVLVVLVVIVVVVVVVGRIPAATATASPISTAVSAVIIVVTGSSVVPGRRVLHGRLAELNAVPPGNIGVIIVSSKGVRQCRSGFGRGEASK